MPRKPKFSQGTYEVRNPNKYVGKGKPRYRSSWELAFMNFCDSNEHIIQWASESVTIPYRHPLTGKQTIYVPDFLVIYRDKHGNQRGELIEIKPQGQSVITEKQNAQQRATVAVNHAKWQVANVWAQKNGLKFRVITENDIFHQGSKKR
jgi:hypothetical protein